MGNYLLVLMPSAAFFQTLQITVTMIKHSDGGYVEYGGWE